MRFDKYVYLKEPTIFTRYFAIRAKLKKTRRIFCNFLTLITMSIWQFCSVKTFLVCSTFFTIISSAKKAKTMSIRSKINTSLYSNWRFKVFCLLYFPRQFDELVCKNEKLYCFDSNYRFWWNILWKFAMNIKSEMHRFYISTLVRYFLSTLESVS